MPHDLVPGTELRSRLQQLLRGGQHQLFCWVKGDAVILNAVGLATLIAKHRSQSHLMVCGTAIQGQLREVVILALPSEQAESVTKCFDVKSPCGSLTLSLNGVEIATAFATCPELAVALQFWLRDTLDDDVLLLTSGQQRRSEQIHKSPSAN